MTTALITIAHGRHRHLERQYAMLARSAVRPEVLVVVAMDDDAVASLDFGSLHPQVVELPKGASGLPLAAARNLGASVAIAGGADILVFLDVDCLPHRDLITAYQDAARDERWSSSLLCGPVAYLPRVPATGYDLDRLDAEWQPHPARPDPAPGQIVAGEDAALFWSLSFAVTAATWQRIGGFDESYEGYGGEDTDFAMVAAAVSVRVAWVGSARASHQHHPTYSPPVQHLDDIVRNAGIFRQRWGTWPMTGWLDDFARAGLIDWSDDGPVIRIWE